MNSLVGITLSLLLHLSVGLLFDLQKESHDIDFGMNSGAIVVRLGQTSHQSSATTDHKSTSHVDSGAQKEVPEGFDELIINFQIPEYPFLAVKNSIEGKVLIALEIDDQGLVEKVSLLKSSGTSSLDEASMKAAKNWKFKSGIKKSLRKEIIFKLN